MASAAAAAVVTYSVDGITVAAMVAADMPARTRRTAVQADHSPVARKKRQHAAAGARIVMTGVTASAVFGLTTVIAAANQPAATPAATTVPPGAVLTPDPTAATDIDKRKVETIQTLYFKSDSLELVLYDNGEVDGDTVSIVMNGTVIMPKVGLTTNAVKKKISTKDAGDSIRIIMYAESLGSLPPNTGLLIVNDGNDRYEIRFSGDMERNAAIVFRRRE